MLEDTVIACVLEIKLLAATDTPYRNVAGVLQEAGDADSRARTRSQV